MVTGHNSGLQFGFYMRPRAHLLVPPYACAVRIMMYGFGDTVCPLDETVDLVEVRGVGYTDGQNLRTGGGGVAGDCCNW